MKKIFFIITTILFPALAQAQVNHDVTPTLFLTASGGITSQVEQDFDIDSDGNIYWGVNMGSGVPSRIYKLNSSGVTQSYITNATEHAASVGLVGTDKIFSSFSSTHETTITDLDGNNSVTYDFAGFPGTISHAAGWVEGNTFIVRTAVDGNMQFVKATLENGVATAVKTYTSDIVSGSRGTNQGYTYYNGRLYGLFDADGSTSGPKRLDEWVLNDSTNTAVITRTFSWDDSAEAQAVAIKNDTVYYGNSVSKIYTFPLIAPDDNTPPDNTFSNNYNYCREMTMTAGGLSGGVATTSTIGYPLVATSTIADLRSTYYDGKVEVISNNKPLDIIFTNSSDCATPGSQINHYFEEYDSTTGEIAVWIKAPDISSTTAKTITMYYGNSNATDTQNKNGVWDNQGIVGKYDLDDGDSTAAGFYKDATVNNNNGTLTDADGDSSVKIGQAGASFSLNDPSDKIDIADSSVFDGFNDFTISFWLDSADTTAAIEYIISKYNTTGNQRAWSVLKSNTASAVRMNLSTDGTNFTAVADIPWLDALNGKTNHIVFNRRGSTVTSYLNGSIISTGTFSGALHPSNTASVTIGQWNGNNGISPAEYDDIRIYDEGLENADIFTIYNNMIDSSRFWTIGDEELAPESDGGSPFTGIRISKPSSYLFNSNGIIAHWTFDGAQMVSNAGDLSVNANNLFLSGFTSTTTVLGRTGQALQFDGVDDYAQRDSQVVSGYPFTLSAWVRTTDVTGSGVIMEVLDKDVVNVSYGIRVASDNDTTKAGMYAQNTTYDEIQSTTSITDGNWHHVAGVFNSATDRKIYVNGVEEASDNTSVAYSSAVDRISVGRNGDETPTGYFNGSLDDMRIYNRSLSEREIKALVNTGVTKLNTAQQKKAPSLIGYWTFNGPDLLQNVRDLSGNNNTGYLQNFTSTTTSIGKNGQALSFDGVNDYVDFGNANSVDELKPSLPVTISAWVKIVNEGSTGTIFIANDSTSYAGYEISFLGSTGQTFLSYGDNTSSGSTGRRSKTGTTNIADNEWHHVVGVIRGATDMDIYVDAVNDGGTYSGTGGDMVYTNAPSRIGLYSVSTPEEYTKGVIDDVRVYNSALSANEVISLYKFGGGR